MMKKRVSSKQAGFTLIEMLVVTGIITVITGLVLVNNGRFGGQVLLQNLTYDIALSIRQAQVYGISVARFNDVYAPAYGMHFASASSHTYVLFADALTPQNGTYECPSPGTTNCELIRSTTIQAGYSVSSLCATPSGSSEVCGLSDLDISFQRPEPDAYIRATELNGLNEAARVIVRSPQGMTKSITVGVNGQIAVQ